MNTLAGKCVEKTVFLFSGQGSQYVGMAVELCENFECAKKIFDTASKVLGYDLFDIVKNGTEQTLGLTKHSQPAIMATSLAAFEAAKQQGFEFAGVAGHSLGEYAAMVASGVVSLEDGFKLIKTRAEAMQKAAEQNSGSMYAIIGLPAEEVEKVCEQVEGYVVPVNYNSSVQTVIAGETQAVEKAAEIFAGMKKRAIKLNVASAFHSRLMQSAADEFVETAETVSFNAPNVEFYSNVYGDVLKDFSDMPNLLAKHIVSPVYFTKELELMQKNGYVNFVELGPNKVLTGLVKKTLKGVNAVNIENIATLEKAIETIAK